MLTQIVECLNKIEEQAVQGFRVTRAIRYKKILEQVEKIREIILDDIQRKK
jgi:hypothetical protein